MAQTFKCDSCGKRSSYKIGAKVLCCRKCWMESAADYKAEARIDRDAELALERQYEDHFERCGGF
jgi:ribosomal protein L37AE/L43A